MEAMACLHSHFLTLKDPSMVRQAGPCTQGCPGKSMSPLLMGKKDLAQEQEGFSFKLGNVPHFFVPSVSTSVKWALHLILAKHFKWWSCSSWFLYFILQREWNESRLLQKKPLCPSSSIRLCFQGMLRNKTPNRSCWCPFKSLKYLLTHKYTERTRINSKSKWISQEALHSNVELLERNIWNCHFCQLYNTTWSPVHNEP